MESCKARDFAHAPNTREPSMTDDSARENGVSIDPRVTAYEARLIRLEGELPGFERDLRRVQAKSTDGPPADRDL
jgi:hypothetical protein